MFFIIGFWKVTYILEFLSRLSIYIAESIIKNVTTFCVDYALFICRGPPKMDENSGKRRFPTKFKESSL